MRRAASPEARIGEIAEEEDALRRPSRLVVRPVRYDSL